MLTAEEAVRGVPALVLEYLRPRASMGVHSLDILTVRTAAASGATPAFKVVSVLLWCQCSGSTSHSAHEGYVVDYRSEKVVATAPWCVMQQMLGVPGGGLTSSESCMQV